MNQEQILELIRLATEDIRNNFEIEINKLKQKYEPKIEEFKDQTIDPNIVDNESLDMIKSLGEFSGKNSNYISWRNNSKISLGLYIRGSRKYFAALTILRNKITSEANDVLTNHGTVFNYDAIIARLDYAYADKRPIHIIEQEMSILKQNNNSLIEYYDKVNEKLTALINKTTLTHGNCTLTNELNAMNRQKALRIFISGLNGNTSNILFSINPPDLPSALAKAQELQSNYERATFATQFYNFTQNPLKHENNLRFQRKEFKNNQTTQRQNHTQVNRVEKMETDSSLNRYREKTNYTPQVNNTQASNNPGFTPRFNNKPFSPREAFKRGRNDSQQSYRPAQKTERINNINEDENHFLDDRSDYHISEE